MHIDAHIGPARVDIGPHIELGAKAVGNRILDFQRRKIQAGQRAVLGGDLDLEGLFGREPDFPCDVGRRVVEVLLASVLVVLQLDEHALGESAVQVELQGIAP